MAGGGGPGPGHQPRWIWLCGCGLGSCVRWRATPYLACTFHPHTYSTICCYFDGLTQGSTVARPRELAADVCASSVLGGVAAYTALHYQHRLAAGETVLVLDGWGLARGCV